MLLNGPVVSSCRYSLIAIHLNLLPGKREGAPRSWARRASIGAYGLEAVAAACAEALAANTPSRDVVLNILSHTHDDPDAPIFSLDEHLPVLSSEPVAFCGRYDALLSGGEQYA